jgi:outer membrane protein OmpA-like peptidoglycan-associated protein
VSTNHVMSTRRNRSCRKLPRLATRRSTAVVVLTLLLTALGTACSGRSRIPAAPPPELEPAPTDAQALQPRAAEPEEPRPATTSLAAAAAVHSEADLETPPLPPPLPEARAKEELQEQEQEPEPQARPSPQPAPRSAAGERPAGAEGDPPWLVYEQVYGLNDLSFEPGGAELEEAHRALLDQLLARLRLEDAGYLIEIRGHTDASGPQEANLALGERRARAVRDYLHREGGLPLHRLSTLSLGAAQPLADNATAEGRARNRRVTVVVLRPTLYAPGPEGGDAARQPDEPPPATRPPPDI